LPEFRTRFHRKPSTESWSLAASELALELAGGLTSVLRASQCKTGIYNMLGGKGQTGGGGMWRLAYPWGGLGEIPSASLRAGSSLCLKNGSVQDDSQAIASALDGNPKKDRCGIPLLAKAARSGAPQVRERADSRGRLSPHEQDLTSNKFCRGSGTGWLRLCVWVRWERFLRCRRWCGPLSGCGRGRGR
jgi:hypothetical protein